MGGNESKIITTSNECGSIEITVEEPYNVVGEIIRGKVIITAIKELPMRKLEISFSGEENIMVYKSRRETTLVNQTYVLAEAIEDPNLHSPLPKLLPPGTHEFPFTIPIPIENIPSSCSYRSDALYCISSYHLTGYFTSFIQTISNMKNYKNIEILQQLKSEHNKNIIKESPVKGLLSSVGSAQLSVTIDHTGFIIPLGMEIAIMYANLDCSENVKSIEVTLVEHIQVKINESANYDDENVVAMWSFPGVKAREVEERQGRLTIEEKERMESMETCNGKLFSKNYILRIKPVYQMKVCKQKPSVECEIRVTRRIRGIDKIDPVKVKDVKEAEDTYTMINPPESKIVLAAEQAHPQPQDVDLPQPVEIPQN